ncbi:MAG: hypothetical protein KDC45_02800 [Bacteroidetes bacterium]|nr:hypothetical protein [Bacteroidota bacterium]
MLFGEKPKKSIKGSLLVGRLQFIKHLNLNWMEILKQMRMEADNDLKSLVRSNFALEEYFATPDFMVRGLSAATWYPATLYNGMIRGMIIQASKEKGLTAEDVCKQSGRFTAEQHLRGIMSFVLNWGSIERTISLISKGWAAYYSGGEIRNVKNTVGEAQVDVVIDYLIPELQFVTVGYFEKVMEKKNAANFSIRSGYTKEEGGTFHYYFKWDA